MTNITDQNELVNDKAVLSSKDIYGTALFNDFIVNLPDNIKLEILGLDTDNNGPRSGRVEHAATCYVMAFKYFQEQLAKPLDELIGEVYPGL